MADRRRRILVIDDYQPFLDLVRDILEGADYEVVTALKPVPVEKTEGFDLVIVDLLYARAPEGIGLVVDLLAAAPDRRIVVCSADRGVLREHGKKLAGPNVRVLFKPFEIDELVGVVEGLLPA